MRVSCTSDLHGHLPNIPKCDLLLIAGDICPFKDHSVDYQRRWLGHKFAGWIDSPRMQAREVVWIAGNHDFAPAAEGGQTKRLSRLTHATYLQDSSIEIGGIKIYGTPWSEILSGAPIEWSFSVTDEQLQRVWAAIPDDTDILLTHAPPYSHGDLIPGGRYVDNSGLVVKDAELLGSPSLAERLDEVQPRLHVYGHIHEGYGIYHRRKSTLVNASHCDWNGRPRNAPVVLDF